MDNDGHGTHVAGSLAGAAASGGATNGEDGVAPGAKLAFTDLGDTDGCAGFECCKPVLSKCSAPANFYTHLVQLTHRCLDEPAHLLSTQFAR